jgi:uncharacterized membrane protein
MFTWQRRCGVIEPMDGFLRNKHPEHDQVWHVQIVMLIAIVLQVALPDAFSNLARYGVPALETLLLLALAFTTPKKRVFKSITRRVNVILLIAIATMANGYALWIVCDKLLKGGHISSGRQLILAGVNIFLTNIIVFALWYWEMDGGGPGERQQIEPHQQDFLFQQQRHTEFKHPDWRPMFTDYLYTSSTNAMTFGPADTMPLSRRAKMLMLTQSTVSLVVVALVAARAVGILS